MRIAHLADVHLGYRAYNRITSQGLNQREVDVFRAFESVLKKITELDPDIVIVAGDLFHSVRPSNFTIYQAFRLISEFRSHCCAPIVLVGGNHDTPKSVDTGCILDLFQSIDDVFVQHHDFSAFAFEALGACVYCLPYFALQERESLQIRPVDRDSVNILAVHGTLEGVMRQSYDIDQVTPGELHLDEWDYAAFGHYHIQSRVGERAFYSGATEFTSTNIWEECAAHPKGFLIFDTGSGEEQFHPVPRCRTVLDLPAIDASAVAAADLMRKIEDALQGCGAGLEEKIVRVVAEGLPRQLQRELDWQRLRELKSGTLHLDVVLRPRDERETGQTRDGAAAGRTLEDEWTEFVAGLEDIPTGVDRHTVATMGLEYLGQTVQVEAA